MLCDVRQTLVRQQGQRQMVPFRKCLPERSIKYRPQFFIALITPSCSVCMPVLVWFGWIVSSCDFIFLSLAA